MSFHICLILTLAIFNLFGCSIGNAQSYANSDGINNPSMLYEGSNSAPVQAPDMYSSASGYGGHSNDGGSVIGGLLGDITGNLLRQILRSLTGIGIKLGVNLNNEFYKVPEYGYGQNGGGEYGQNGGGGYGHGGYSRSNSHANGYSNIQELVANTNQRSQKLPNEQYQNLLKLNERNNFQKTAANANERNQMIQNNNNYRNLLNEYSNIQETIAKANLRTQNNNYQNVLNENSNFPETVANVNERNQRIRNNVY